MAALQKALVTFNEVHVLCLILSRMSSASDSMISSSSAVKCFELLGTDVRFRGRLERDPDGRRSSFGRASLRRFSAIAAISL